MEFASPWVMRQLLSQAVDYVECKHSDDYYTQVNNNLISLSAKIYFLKILALSFNLLHKARFLLMWMLRIPEAHT